MSRETITLSLEQVEALALRFFLDLGISIPLAKVLAARMRAAERDGPASHGLAMLPYYAEIVRSGTVNTDPHPSWKAPRPGLIELDCDGGFAQLGLELSRQTLIDATKAQGIVALVTRKAPYIGALRHEILPLADTGLIAIMVGGSRPWVVPHGGKAPILGTNPMAFACPCADRPPILWDQATSLMSISDVRLAEAHGKQFDEPVGLDRNGNPSRDPGAIIEGQRLLPFGEHKGTAIALMVEILAAGLSGGSFAVEYENSAGPVNRTGQTIIAIDPRAAEAGFAQHLSVLIEAFSKNGDARIPGDGRFCRAAKADTCGVDVPDWLVARLGATGADLSYG